MDKKNMEPHQQRVVIERDELQDKYNKLKVFIESNSIFKGLKENEQQNLQIQL